MSVGYLTRTYEHAAHDHHGTRLNSGMCRINALLRHFAQPATLGKPMGVYLPDRVWRRQSALFFCLQAEQRSGRTHE